MKATNEFYLQLQLGSCSQGLLNGILCPAGTTAEDTSPKDQYDLSFQYVYTNRSFETSGCTNL